MSPSRLRSRRFSNGAARAKHIAGWRSAAARKPRVTPELAAFLGQRDSAYLATANSARQPYIQHRAGPRGFIRVLDDRTLDFADFVGNRQYITTGNLAANDRAFLFLMDYAHRQRIKIWGKARVVENDAELLAKLMPEGYDARPQQAILFTIEASDVNCPQPIPQKFDATDVTAAVTKVERRISELDAENARLREALARTRWVKTER